MRYRIRQNWRGKLIVQYEQTLNHMDDLGGSGYYDEYQTKRWRDAGTEHLADIVAMMAARESNNAQ